MIFGDSKIGSLFSFNIFRNNEHGNAGLVDNSCRKDSGEKLADENIS